VVGLLVLAVNGDSIGDDADLFTLALTLQSSTNVDIGQDAFNQMFWDSPEHILKRECSTCGSVHKVIYYKRYTDLDSFNLYKYTYDWESTNNKLGDDFNLFSTLEDALADTNPWKYCNYDDNNIGMFRDCGPTGFVAHEWTSRTRGGDSASFYIYTGLGVHSYSHVGCYKDTGARALNSGPGGADITIEACHQWSVQNGFLYFALQHGGASSKGECRCSNSLSAATQFGTASNCEAGTGGSWANDLYENAPDTTSPPSSEPSDMPTMEPTKNCDVLHIDEFLLDCSAEWENAGHVMEVVYNATAANSHAIVANAGSMATNAANIATGSAAISSNADSIATNAANVALNAGNIATATAAISTNADNIVTITSSSNTNGADITSLQQRVAALEDIVDQLGVNSAANAAAPMNYAVDETVGMTDGAWNVVTVTGKDLGIVVLAAINVVMIAMMVIACKRSGGRTKYHPVAVGSDLEPINA